MDDNRTIIRIRQGLNGFPFSICNSAGKWISNADSIEQIREQYSYELKHKIIKLVKETKLYPEGEAPSSIIYGYARVSTHGQARDGNSLDAQEQTLRKAGADVIIREEYTGTKKERPELDQLLCRLTGGDTLMVTKLDRIARSTLQGTELINDLLDRRINVHILNIGKMDNTPSGKLIRTVFLGFAEFERDMIVERTQEGKALAKQNPQFHEGRPKKFSPDQIEHALNLLNDHSYTQVEKMTGISKSTLIREKKKRRQYSPF